VTARFPPAAHVTRKLYIRTFGCQMNEYDSARMADVLHEADGLDLTEHPEEADVILFNTCSVREKAQERVFHDLGRVRELKTANPELIIGVGGCVASGRRRNRAAAPFVDVVFGPRPAPAARSHRAPPRDGPAAGGRQLSGDREVRSSAAAAG
jgi:tRNA-2-methylthio-N6-dimethylallyladenosine synthase